MDRNLGALVAATVESAPISSYGLYYHWGRKDPFPGANGVSSAGTIPTTADGPQPMSFTVLNPTVFLKVTESDSGGNWNSKNDGDIWDDGKSTFDPCPPGYHVPNLGRNSCYLWEETGEGWSFDYDKGWFKKDDSVFVFPLAGYITSSIKGSYSGTRAILWCGACYSAPRGYCKLIRQDKGGYYYNNYFKMEAGSIRCCVFNP